MTLSNRRVNNLLYYDEDKIKYRQNINGSGINSKIEMPEERG